MYCFIFGLIDEHTDSRWLTGSSKDRVSGEGESRPKTKKKGVISEVPEIGEALCAYTAGCKNYTQRDGNCSQ